MQRFQLKTTDNEPKAEPILFKRILFVENDPDIIRDAQETFDLHFFDVTVVQDGANAIRQLLRSDYDVIVCDMAMPEFPGTMFFEAVSRVKPELCKRFVSIVDLGDSRSSQRIPGTLTIWKPLEMQMMIEAVETVLKKSQRPVPARAQCSKAA